MTSSTITIIGSLNYDLVTYTKAVPEGGETYQANSFENHLGGKGLNEAIATSRLSGKQYNCQIRMVGNVGNDSFGKELKQALVDSGVDTKYVKTLDQQSSGVAVIIVEEDSGENRILITAGANGELCPTSEEYETYFPKDVEGTQFVILQNEYPDTVKSIDWLKANRPKINIAYNPSPFKPEFINQEFWSKIDFLIMNEGEALSVASKLLTEEQNAEFKKTIKQDKVEGFSDLANKLQELINPENVSTVIITMGSKGSIFTSRETKPTFVKSEKVDNVVDTTGAGDTFFGGVVLQLANASSLKEAVEFATKASSLVIQKKGAAESIPTLEEITKHI
mmetsp:Transcript_7827/g.9866  ORF Transcript_7827/g.9866 Transcript_7827/m.9866 type:complete len:336 (+) Transcript_7827:87-1094(+)